MKGRFIKSSKHRCYDHIVLSYMAKNMYRTEVNLIVINGGIL